MTALAAEPLPAALDILVPDGRTYAGIPGGARDPLTPGSYCLARCYCGTCPQHAEQQQLTEARRKNERSARNRNEQEKSALRAHRQQQKRTRRS